MIFVKMKKNVNNYSIVNIIGMGATLYSEFKTNNRKLFFFAVRYGIAYFKR